MFASDMERVAVLTISLFLFIQIICAYEPKVTIQALIPKGLKASIPDEPTITLFAFNGNINKPIEQFDVGTISAEVTKAKSGRWMAENNRVELKVGDVVNYYIFVSVNRTGHMSDIYNFTVTSLEDAFIAAPNTNPRPKNCKPTATKVLGGTACAGQIIMEDNFSTFRDDLWQIEHYIPINSLEKSFVTYQHLFTDPTVSVADGNLRIKTKFQKDQPGFSDNDLYTGTLDLVNGCTAEVCTKTAWGAFIIPPIVSGKVTSKGFAFTYGTVYIRAKIPQGDWLYPDILLEPYLKKYGATDYSSGVIKIASARGNRELKRRKTDYSNKVLYGGPIMNYDCRELLLSTKTLPEGQQWGDDFHVYAVRWEPERITLLVDDVEWARVEPTAEGLQGKLPAHCKLLPRSILLQGGKMAPFDDFFYITLGVNAGGVLEFPNLVETAGGRRIPWKNSSKAWLTFWNDKDNWFPTWNQPQMLVDYVRVVAL